ncbi:pilus assembly protein TadG-related protein [Sphingomonas sp.]|uniref:pilus assembly protein TadG-related protein n=1 Tax=Sphingomonas sp. TaxID=28214 RepID=UPI002CC43AA0|nr:pilus assembly protein TadG-related protein [Sphingomonas sp.]HTG37789.1 pilus assembly protein TadG-related protein [Sphingomonas sp.]
MIRLSRLASERRGAVAVLVAGAMPMLLGMAALAVDLGVVQLERRRLQGVADAGALAAARDLERARPLAEALVAASPGNFPVQSAVATGRYRTDTGLTADQRLVVGSTGADAVRVSVQATVPTFFARVFGTDAITVERRATARRVDMAGFAIGSRLLGLNGGVANALLSGLTGGNVSLSVMDYQALASARLDLLPWLPVLGADAGLSVATYDSVLQAELPAGTVLGSLSRQVVDPVASAALSQLATTATGTIRLAELIDLGELGRQDGGGGGLVEVSTLDLASNVIQGSASNRQVAIDLGAQVPGIATTRLWVAIGERPNNAPWIALSRHGSPVVRTAQTRIYAEAKLNAQPLPGLSLASVELPVFVELASGEARLERIDCARPRSVVLSGRPSPGQVAIAQIDPSRLNDFRTPMTLSRADLLKTLLLRLEGRAAIDLGAAEPFQTRHFDADAIAARSVQTVKGQALAGGIAASLMQRIELRGVVLGLLPIPVDPVVQAVGGQLALLAPVLDPLLNTVTGLLGVGVGEADLWVTGLRCGQPVLVE